MKAMTIEEKTQYVNDKKEQFLSSGKTSTPEYKEKFESWTIEQQFAAIRRQETYNERKNNGTQNTKKTSTRTSSLNRVDLLMNGIEVEMTNEEAMELQEKFKKAIETCETIIESNKNKMKADLEKQLAEIQEQLKQFK